jgi:hypothetical protein
MMLKQESLKLDAEPALTMLGESSVKKPAYSNGIKSAVKSRFELNNHSIARTHSYLSEQN